MKSLIHLNVHIEFISLVYTGSFKLPGVNSLGVHNIILGVVCSITKVKQFFAKLLKDYLNCQKLTYIYDTTMNRSCFLIRLIDMSIDENKKIAMFPPT